MSEHYICEVSEKVACPSTAWTVMWKSPTTAASPA